MHCNIRRVLHSTFQHVNTHSSDMMFKLQVLSKIPCCLKMVLFKLIRFCVLEYYKISAGNDRKLFFFKTISLNVAVLLSSRLTKTFTTVEILQGIFKTDFSANFKNSCDNCTYILETFSLVQLLQNIYTFWETT